MVFAELRMSAIWSVDVVTRIPSTLAAARRALLLKASQRHLFYGFRNVLVHGEALQVRTNQVLYEGDGDIKGATRIINQLPDYIVIFQEFAIARKLAEDALLHILHGSDGFNLRVAQLG